MAELLVAGRGNDGKVSEGWVRWDGGEALEVSDIKAELEGSAEEEVLDEGNGNCDWDWDSRWRAWAMEEAMVSLEPGWTTRHWKKEEMCTSLRSLCKQLQLQFKDKPPKSGYGQVRTWLRKRSGI